MPEHKKLKIIEFFGGIGACSKALERIGVDVELVDYVEIDKYAVASFNAMHGTNFEPQDISEWDKDVEVDLIMHGSPCQDFSLAGKQAGGDKDSGTRSSLMYETIRIVEKLRPKYVVWENVKNLISKKHKHNFDAYLETMESLGYTNYWRVLNSKDYGIPQNRERVFTISVLNDGSFEMPVGKETQLTIEDIMDDDAESKFYINKALNIEEKENYIQWDNSGKGYNSQQDRGYFTDKLCPTLSHCNNNGDKSQVVLCKKFEFPEKLELTLKLKDMLEDEVDEKYFLSDKMIQYISKVGTENFKNHDCKINKDVARPITTDQNKRAGTTNYLSDDVGGEYDLCQRFKPLSIE